MKTASYFHKIGGMDGNEIENFIRLFVQNKIDDARMDALITGIAVTGSRCRGMENSESDLMLLWNLQQKKEKMFCLICFMRICLVLMELL